MKILKLFLALIILSAVYSCSVDDPEIAEYIENIVARREITDEWMENDPNSPFNYKGKVEFSGLNYFDVDPEFVFKSKFYDLDQKDTIIIMGTKGEERKASRIGYLKIDNNNKIHHLNVYENYGKDGSVYHSIWFTDETTNKDTYGVGRYLSFELNPNKDFIYTIDFNVAFNPYCAYNSDYSCAIPTKQDHLDLAVRAGEKKYHD
jgi:uncharacterized protein (DUF1684 family)